MSHDHVAVPSPASDAASLRLPGARWGFLAMLLWVAFGADPAHGQGVTAPADSLRRTALGFRRLGVEGRLLYITAHPDDEDNRLLAYYRHGLGFEVTLLTLTRGDGGQNEIGPELFEALGVLRSEELRAAHRFDGARQRFSRAFEFGYSFSEAETFQKWGEEEILRDTVQVIREVRPQVICTMPVLTAGGGRHHQASAFLGRRAFDVAATDQWPELGPPHAVDRLFESAWTGPRPESFTMPLDRFDPVLGTTYEQLGFVARSFHKCQGTGQVAPLGSSMRSGRWHLVRSRGPAPVARDDLFSGLPVYRNLKTGEPSIQRPILEEVTPSVLAPQQWAPALRRAMESWHPSVRPGALSLWSEAVGFHRAAVATRAEVIPGGEVSVRVLLENRGDSDIHVLGSFLKGDDAARTTWDGGFGPTLVLKPGTNRVETLRVSVPREARGWTAVRLEREPGVDRYQTANRDLPVQAALWLHTYAEVDGWPIALPPVPVVARSENSQFPALEESELALVPPVEVEFLAEVFPAAVDSSSYQGLGQVHWEVMAREPGYQVEIWADHRLIDTRAATTGRISLDLPVSLPAGEGLHDFDVEARVIGPDGTSEPAVALQRISYPHIRLARLQRPARSRVVVLRCEVPRGRRVGWVAGAGDRVLEALEALRIPVRVLSDHDLLTGSLDDLDVVVTGVRAYKVRAGLRDGVDGLRHWMEQGGHLVVLYNKAEEMNRGPLARGGSPYTPWPARVTHDRVTVEESPVQMLVPSHPFFTRPNSLGADDWAGWVQERGLYFLETRDPRYESLLSLQDPWPANGGEKKGSLVTTPVGSGRWTYVGLSLFRQLPAGVPGAYRLMCNLLGR